MVWSEVSGAASFGVAPTFSFACNCPKHIDGDGTSKCRLSSVLLRCGPSENILFAGTVRAKKTRAYKFMRIRSRFAHNMNAYIGAQVTGGCGARIDI